MLDKEYKEQSRVVAGWVLNYWQRKKEYEDKLKKYEQESLGVGSSVIELVPIHGTLPNDRTGKQAVKLAEMKQEIEKHRAWLELVEELERRLPWKMQLILRLRWDVVERRGIIKSGKYGGRPAWIPYVQHRYCAAVAKRTGKREEDCWVDRPADFVVWWQKIVNYGVVLAMKKGLLS